MKKVILCFTAAILSLALINTCHAGEKILLRCKLEKGKTYPCRFAVDENISMDLRGITLITDGSSVANSARNCPAI